MAEQHLRELLFCKDSASSPPRGVPAKKCPVCPRAQREPKMPQDTESKQRVSAWDENVVQVELELNLNSLCASPLGPIAIDVVIFHVEERRCHFILPTQSNSPPGGRAEQQKSALKRNFQKVVSNPWQNLWLSRLFHQ